MLASENDVSAYEVFGRQTSALRYVPRLDRNTALRDRIVTLAHRHRRYGAGMIRLLSAASARQQHRASAHTRFEQSHQGKSLAGWAGIRDLKKMVLGASGGTTGKGPDGLNRLLEKAHG